MHQRHHLANTLEQLSEHAKALVLMQAAADGLNALCGPAYQHTKESAAAFAAMLAARHSNERD
ncbi:MAG: hypothetical protein JSR83_20365 [Proteobacteria bacterium]|nr:hypothetical protein [Pseudomonadota bacterium]